MGDIIKKNLNDDGIDRRGFLKCMAWAGTGTLCVMQGGVLKSFAFGHPGNTDKAATQGDFAFAQISDSHIGFDKAANPDVTATLRAAIDKLNALPTAPEFVLHTGDLSQLSKADEFDTLDQAMKSVHTDRIFYVPGEHDVLNDNGEQYRARYGKGTLGDGWQSFDHKGVHFIGLVNVLNLKAGGLGSSSHRSGCARRFAPISDHSSCIPRRAGCPVWVGTRRSAAARALLAAHPDCGVIISDDGLQHYALARDVEIAVIDGERGFAHHFGQRRVRMADACDVFRCGLELHRHDRFRDERGQGKVSAGRNGRVPVQTN